jgi:hypothetical protein
MAMPLSTAEFLKIATDLGAFAILAWLILYVVRTALPKALNTFLIHSENQRLDFKEALAQQREDFLVELRERHVSDCPKTQ